MKKINKGLLIFLTFFSVHAFAKKFSNKDTSPAYTQLQASIEAGLNLQDRIYFAIPKSATPAKFDGIDYAIPADSTDDLFYFKHPQSTNEANPLGLRFYLADRSKKVGINLANSKFVQSGDVIISFRPDWAHAGPYPQAQMGQTHTGLVYIDEFGLLKNIEHPLEDKFLLPDAVDPRDIQAYLDPEDLSDENVYKTQPMLHFFRPRFMTDARRANFDKWAKLLRKMTSANPVVRADHTLSIFPKFIDFNINYMAPKFRRGNPTQYGWVKLMGQYILNKPELPPAHALDMYCSELVWTFLSLSNCDPENQADKQAIFGDGPAACIDPAFKPMPMVGDLFVNERPANQREAGLSDGPALVIDSQKSEATPAHFNSIFEAASGPEVLSVGQKSIVRQVTPAFMSLKDYYVGMYDNTQIAQDLRRRYNMQSGDNGFKQPNLRDHSPNPALTDPIYFLDNYSPTSYGINSYLPEDNVNRRFDYVGTLAFRDMLFPQAQQPQQRR